MGSAQHLSVSVPLQSAIVTCVGASLLLLSDSIGISNTTAASRSLYAADCIAYYSENVLAIDFC